MQNFEIVIVSAVKIYKQCLQTASADFLPRASPLDTTGKLPSPYHLGYMPKNENFWHRRAADK